MYVLIMPTKFGRSSQTCQKVLLLLHRNQNALLHVLHKIINKTHANVIAQNDTAFPGIKLDINVSKCCAFVKHFETLIS